MFFLGTGAAKTAPEFVPDEESRGFIADTLAGLLPRLGAVAQAPRVLTRPPSATPKDLDGLFDLVCGAQAEVGQEEVEFTLLQTTGDEEPLPDDFRALGPPEGKMLLSAFGRREYVMLFSPGVFAKTELLLASVARELGRIAIHRAGGHGETETTEWDAESELAAVSLGMGIWVANGSYIFENSCCGGGCGVDLRSLRAGLSMPEACYAAAIDGQRRGIARRIIARHLEPTQKSAFKKSWSQVSREGILALAGVDAAGAKALEASESRSRA